MTNDVYILPDLSPDSFAGASDITHHMHKLVNEHEIIRLRLQDFLHWVKQLAIQQIFKNFVWVHRQICQDPTCFQLDAPEDFMLGRLF